MFTLPAKARFTEAEIEQLAQQMTFDEVFESLMQDYLEQSQINARIERDEALVLYWMTKQTGSVGAVQAGDQFNLSYSGFDVTAKPGSESTTVNHSKIYEEIEKLRSYYQVMADDAKEVAVATGEDSKLHEYEIWNAKLEVAEDVFKIKDRNTTKKSSGKYGLKVGVASTKPKRASRSKKAAAAPPEDEAND